jgi:hypothetical protein
MPSDNPTSPRPRFQPFDARTAGLRSLISPLSTLASLGIAVSATFVTTTARAASADTQDDRDAGRIEKMGVDSRFYSATDHGLVTGPDPALGGGDEALPGWDFPRLEAAQLVEGDLLTFNLPGGRTIDLPLVDRTWVGPGALGLAFSDPIQGASAEIVLHAGLVSGGVRFVQDGRVERWLLATRFDANGFASDRYYVAEAGTSIGTPMDAPEEVLAFGSEGGVANDGCSDSGATIDVLIATTPVFRAGFESNSVMEASILADLQRMNLAQVNSLGAPRFRVVQFFAGTENGTGSLATDLTQLAVPTDGWLDGVHAARNTSRADLVVLYTNSEPGWAAFVGVGNEATGFGVVGGVGGFNLSRALASTMGSCNAPGDSTPACAGSFPFSNAHRFVAGGITYRTIMALPPGEEIPHFSNPAVKFQNVATGTSTANNSRSLSLTASVVASYRCSDGPNPDCDGDGILDSVAIAAGLVPDCNLTGFPDSCDIALGISIDANGNGIPDECPLIDRQFTPSGVAVLDTLGTSVSASTRAGDPAILYGFGAPGSDVGAANAGAAWVIPVTAGVPNTALARVLRASDPVANAFFGRSISVFKRPASVTPAYAARTMACVGAFRWNQSGSTGNFPSKGAIYLFDEQPDTSWAQVGFGAGPTPWRYTPPTTGGSAAGAYSMFGYSVAMGRSPAETSETIIVGAPGRSNGIGAVYVIRNPANNTPTLHVLRALSTGVEGDAFGTAVALSTLVPTSGNARVSFVAGAPGRADNTGTAVIYERAVSSLSFGTWSAPLTLNPVGIALAEGDRFGAAVAIQARPNTPAVSPTALVAVGAPGDDDGRGRVHFWERGTGTGTTTSTWSYRGSIQPSNAKPGDGFGSSVAISLTSDPLVFNVTVGAPGRDVEVGTTLRQNAGAVYLVKKSAGVNGAGIISVRSAFSPATGDEFGYSAAAVPGFAIIGAPFNDTAGLNAGMTRINVNP